MFQLGAVMDIIGQLPVELALEVFRYLSPQDLGVCCLVSKTWRSYANADFLWKRICLREGISLSIPFSAPLILEDYNGDNDYESMDYLPDGCYPESLYYSSDSEDTSSCSADCMENISPWAYAFACYSLRNIQNWKDNRKSVHVIATLDNTMVAVRDTTLVYSDELGVLFVYQLSDRTRFVQTIDLVLEKPLIGLDMTNQHIVVKQGDIITLYHKQLQNFVLKGFLVPVEGSYVFTRHYYPSEVSFVRHAVIHDAICILSDNCIYIYSLRNSSMRSYKVDSMSFMLSDKHRVYVGTGKNEVTGIDSNGSYIDLPLKPSSVVCIKSNQNIIVSLVSEEYHSGRYYMFKVWSKKYAYREFNTSRPFGLKVAQRGSRFAAVANDKFGQKVFVSIYDLDSDTKNDVDLNASEPIAQAKIQFIGRDLLYIVTRKDWGPYDMGYLVDLGTMTTLYDVELDHTGVVSIDSKLAVYLNTETIEIHYYNR